MLRKALCQLRSIFNPKHFVRVLSLFLCARVCVSVCVCALARFLNYDIPSITGMSGSWSVIPDSRGGSGRITSGTPYELRIVTSLGHFVSKKENTMKICITPESPLINSNNCCDTFLHWWAMAWRLQPLRAPSDREGALRARLHIEGQREAKEVKEAPRDTVIGRDAAAVSAPACVWLECVAGASNWLGGPQRASGSRSEAVGIAHWALGWQRRPSWRLGGPAPARIRGATAAACTLG